MEHPLGKPHGPLSFSVSFVSGSFFFSALIGFVAEELIPVLGLVDVVVGCGVVFAGAIVGCVAVAGALSFCPSSHAMETLETAS